MKELTKKGTFFFDPDDPIYKDHFPGNPVVPGSLIVQAFLTACRKDFELQPCTVEDFRFRKFISPGEYAYEIIALSAGLNERQVKCRLFHGEKTVVTGKLKNILFV